MMKIRLQIIRLCAGLLEDVFFYPKLRRFYRRAFSGNAGQNTIVDIGANRGQYLRFALKNVPNARIFSIEANEDLMPRLRKQYGSRENVTLLNEAISDKAGIKIFNINPFDETSSFEQADEETKYNKFKKILTGGEVRKKQVEAKSLPTLCREHDITGIDLLKIDAEGHEYYILKGCFAERDGPAIARIQIEHHFIENYKKQVSFAEIEALLKENGFLVEEKIKHGFSNLHDIIFAREGRARRSAAR